MALHLSYYQRNMFATCAAHDVQTNNNLLFVRAFFTYSLFVVRCFAPSILSFKSDFRKNQSKEKNGSNENKDIKGIFFVCLSEYIKCRLK